MFFGDVLQNADTENKAKMLVKRVVKKMWVGVKMP